MSIEEDTKIIEDTEPTEPLCGEPVKEETNEVIQKPKVKKPRSEAQIKAFEVARQKLAEKRKINKENKEKEMAVKVKEKELEKRKVKEVNQKFEELVVNEEEEPVVITKPKQTRKKKAKQKIILEEDDSSSDDNEIIIRRVRKGRGKKHPEPSSPKQVSPPSPELPPVEEPIYQEPVPKKYSNKMLLKVFGM